MKYLVILILLLPSIVYAQPYGNLQPYGTGSIFGVPTGTVVQMLALSSPQNGWRYDITDGSSRTDCTVGSGTHKVECCYDETISKWEHCLGGTGPVAVTLSSFAGKGLTGEGGATSIDVKPDVYCANIPAQISVTNWLVVYVPDAMTVTSIYCLVDAGTSVDLTPNECDGDGANCSAIEATITCGSTGQTIAQADIDNTDLDAGDTIRITRGTVTGAVNQAFICLTIEFDD